MLTLYNYIIYIIIMSQIFKTQIPHINLYNFLDNIAEKKHKFYIINNIAFKRGLYNGFVEKFITECKPFYHNSKLKYLERKLTYTSFITIIRQICNFNNIKYTSTIKYDKSNYDIIYYIYF